MRKVQPNSKDSNALFTLAHGISLKKDKLIKTLQTIRNIMLPSNIDIMSDIINKEQVIFIFY